LPFFESLGVAFSELLPLRLALRSIPAIFRTCLRLSNRNGLPIAAITWEEMLGPKPGIDRRYLYSGKQEHTSSILSSTSRKGGRWFQNNVTRDHSEDTFIRGESFSRFRRGVGYRKISLSRFGTNVPFHPSMCVFGGSGCSLLFVVPGSIPGRTKATD